MGNLLPLPWLWAEPTGDGATCGRSAFHVARRALQRRFSRPTGHPNALRVSSAAEMQVLRRLIGQIRFEHEFVAILTPSSPSNKQEIVGRSQKSAVYRYRVGNDPVSWMARHRPQNHYPTSMPPPCGGAPLRRSDSATTRLAGSRGRLEPRFAPTIPPPHSAAWSTRRGLPASSCPSSPPSWPTSSSPSAPLR